jgi:hypothetical protein
MGMRRFTRLSNAFSKKLVNHLHMLLLCFVHDNFCRIHKTLRMSPAMAAGVASDLRDVEWIVSLIDARAEAGTARSYRTRRKFKLRHYPAMKLGLALPLLRQRKRLQQIIELQLRRLPARRGSPLRFRVPAG